MLGDRRLRQGEPGDEVTGQAFTVSEQVKDLAPLGLCQHLERGFHRGQPRARS
jgi:hypothetical protein